MHNPKHFDYNQVRSGHYEKIIWEDHGARQFWHQERFQEMANLVESKADSVILDYGCASGSFLGNLKKPYGSAIGIDIAEPQIELANKKYGHAKLRFLAKDFSELNFEKEVFDYIVISEVIEHIAFDESVQMLRKFHLWLKPNGSLILSTPNYRSLWPFFEFFVNRLSEVDYEHQHINKLDLPKCRAVLDRCGFSIDRLVTIFLFSPFIGFFSPTLAKKFFRWEKRLLPNAGSLILLSAVKK